MIVVTRAGQADERRDALERHDGSATSSAASMSRDGSRDLVRRSAGRVRGGARSCARSRCRPSARPRRRPSPRTNSVEPPPMSTTRYGPATPWARESPRRAGERQRRLLVTGDDLGRRRRVLEARARRRRTSAAFARVAGRRGGDEAHRARRPSSRHASAYSRVTAKRALHAPRGRCARCGRRRGRAGRSPSAAGRRRARPCRVDVGDEQPDRVGAAVDRPHPASLSVAPRRRPRPRARHADSAPPVVEHARAPRRRAG